MTDELTQRLAAAGCVAAREEAAELRAAACDADALEAALRRRERGEPLAWITGTVVFCDRWLHVAPGTFVPRPQTEELARRAAALLPRSGRALDLCTGVGAVAAHLAVAVPGATVIGVDIDERAARAARRNGVAVIVGDLAEAVRPDAAFDAAFDLVTAVAPYVPADDLRLLPADVRDHEPRAALDGGHDGLDVVRRVVAAAASVLRPGGRLLVELGGDQDVRLAPTLAATGFDIVATWHDDHGDLRGLVAQLSAARGAARACARR
jgi:release factor glutamine methyltransferase